MNKIFSHIYIEEKAFSYPLTSTILDRLPASTQIVIKHYKDFFNRPGQDFRLQKGSQKLIIAVKNDNFVYEGSEYCQNFGNTSFYYSSTMLNCLYDCDYCYLQGMYPSANIVAFVNTDDFYNNASLLENKKPYIAVSYDTDLLAFESIIPYVSGWVDFAAKHRNITLEVRTKSANYNAIAHLNSPGNVILAWTLSPDEVITKYEKKTSGLEVRLKSIKAAISNGWKVRLCFDPILKIEGWKDIYTRFMNQVFSQIQPNSVLDVSIGSFRMPIDYLKKIRKSRSDSDLVFYPFAGKNGFAAYPAEIEKELIDFLRDLVEKYLHGTQLFPKLSSDL